MSAIEKDIMLTFLEALRHSDDVSEAVVDGLEEMLQAEKLPKADRVSELIASGSGEPIA